MDKAKVITRIYPPLANRIITPIVLVNPLTQETFETNALWDTGATSSAISTVAVEYLQLKRVGKVIASGLFKSKRVNQYFVKTCIDSNINQMLLVSAFEDSSIEGVDCILGMDLILEGEFNISNTKEGILFTFKLK